MSSATVKKIDASPQAITVRIAATPEEFSMAMAVRAAVFLAEEDNITYFDEFNGNDYAATHLIAFVNGDPAGVIRCRWFAEFAMIERIAVRKRYRSFKVLITLARAAIELCRQKGYKLAVGRARLNTWNFWKRVGFRQSGVAIDHKYLGTLIPGTFDIPHRPDSGAMSPYLLGDPEFENLIVQPEGTWDFSAVPGTTHYPAVAAE